MVIFWPTGQGAGPAGAADYPAVGNVRSGIVYASGSMTGTLTLPAVGDVRSGVQYGASGTEYTGTLYVRSVSGSTWTEDMLDGFNDMVAEFGDTLIFGTNAAIDCVKTALDMAFEMRLSGYARMVDTQIDIRRADMETIHLDRAVAENPATKRPVVLVDEEYFEVMRIQSDKLTDPIVKLICGRKQ